MDPNCADNGGQTLSHYAGRLGHEEILMRSLGRKDAELNGGNNEGLILLAGAVRGRRRDGGDATKMSGR